MATTEAAPVKAEDATNTKIRAPPTLRPLSGNNAAALNAKLADGRSRELFWGTELSADKTSLAWNFEEEEDDREFLEHTLFLRHAVLGAEADVEEQQVVVVDTKNYLGKEISHPIVHIGKGTTSVNLDLNFSSEVPVTFRLLKGKGPVHLVGQHLVEFPPEEDDEFAAETEGETDFDNTAMTEDLSNTEESDEEEDDEEEEEEGETEEEEEKPKGKKRKAAVAKGKLKKGKTVSEADEDDEDEEEMEEEESEDEEEEESEEEVPTPKKKSKQTKDKKVKEQPKKTKETKKAAPKADKKKTKKSK